MKVQKIKGSVSDAYLSVYLSRNGQNEGVAGLAVYSAPLLADGQINVAREWNKFRFIGATWQGRCHRVLSPSSHLQSGEGETVEGHYILNAVPFTKGDDGCSNLSEDINLLELVNGDGLALGFFPSNTGYYVKAVLEYIGEVDVTPF